MSFRSDDERTLLLAFTHWLDNYLTIEQATDWNEQPTQTVDEFLRQRDESREANLTSRKGTS